MSRRRGLGSGLDALIPSTAASPGDAVRQIAVEAIRENRSQPRAKFDEQALTELAASIREHGIIQPLIVSEDAGGAYELIAGERRLRAARLAGLREVPAVVKSATPQQLLELALVENVQRADLNALEEGLAYQTLKDEFGLSDEAIAQRVGKSRVTVVNARRLIKLAPAAREALLAGELSAGHGRALLRFDEPADQEQALQLLLRRDLSVREAERLGEIAQHGQLGGPVKSALLSGALTTAQAQALLRLDDPARQQAALERVLGLGLGARETDQFVDLLAEGLTLSAALAQVRPEGGNQQRGPQQRAAPAALNGEPAVLREQSPEDAEAQRMFEELLETPVQLVRSGGRIRLTIIAYDDEKLQQIYDKLSGMGG
jgi:ParB family chromosome partitioning protein